MVAVCFYCGLTPGHRARTLHLFPLKHPEVLKKWIKNMGLGPSINITKHSRLCTDHFTKDCLELDGFYVQIIRGSVPTLFGEYKRACSYCKVVKINGNHSFHKFPLKNAEILQKWLQEMNIENFVPSSKSQLCNEHFEKSCFRSRSCTRLKPNAVPTIFTATKVKVEVDEESMLDTRETFPEEVEEKFQGARTYERDTFVQDLANETFPVESPVLTSVPKRRSIIRRKFNRHYFFGDSVYVGCGNPLSVDVTSTMINDELTTPIMSTNTIQQIEHDHQYEDSTQTLKKRLLLAQKQNHLLKKRNKLFKQNLGRLKRKHNSLKEIVSELLSQGQDK